MSTDSNARFYQKLPKIDDRLHNELSTTHLSIVNDYYAWLDKQTFINVETFDRFVRNLLTDMRAADQCPKYSVKDIISLVTYRLGYKTYSQLNSKTKTFNEIVKLRKLELLGDKKVRDINQYFFSKHNEYTDAIMSYLTEKYIESLLVNKETFFKMFGTVYQNILSIPLIKESGIEELILKKVCRKCFAWHMRECIETELFLVQCKHTSKFFRETYFKNKVIKVN